MLQVGERQTLVVGDLGQRDGRGSAPPGKLDHHAYAIFGLGGEDHR
jgi:hypothetical protein